VLAIEGVAGIAMAHDESMLERASGLRLPSPLASAAIHTAIVSGVAGNAPRLFALHQPSKAAQARA
jgi:hypothetical protein